MAASLHIFETAMTIVVALLPLWGPAVVWLSVRSPR